MSNAVAAAIGRIVVWGAFAVAAVVVVVNYTTIISMAIAIY